MIGAPNSLNLNCKVRVMKEAPDPSVSEEIADILTNYNIDRYRSPDRVSKTTKLFHSPDVRNLTNGALLCGRQVWNVEAV